MTTRLLLAPAGHGKTHYLIDRIHAIRAAEPLAPVTVILPNQIRVAEFRQRLAQVGGALGVTLTTFHTLYAELLTRTGQPKARLTDPIQIRLLRSIVDRLCEEHRLHHYAPLRGKPGFVAALRDTIQELKRARVEPDTFFTAIMGLGPRLEELAAIYIEYQDWLRKEDWADPEGQGWLAALALVAQSELGHELRLLAVNSFDEFNPTQLGVLALLAERAQETIITLTGDLTRDRLAQRRFIRARQAIIEQLHITPEALNAEHSVRSAELAAIENGLFESHQPTIHDLQSIEFIEAQNRAEEARAALRWIKIRCVRDGLALSEVAVLARDLEPYRAFLEEISAEFGLPLRLIGGAPLIDNPAIAALLSLLSLSMLDWPRRRILEAWRSPYFDWSPYGITLDDAAVLDTVSRIGRVVAGLDQWREAFELLARQKPIDPAVVDEEQAGVDVKPEDIAALRDKFDAFVARVTPPANADIREHAAFVEDLIGDDPRLATRFTRSAAEDEDASLAVVDRAEDNLSTAPRDIAALRAFKDVLRGLVLAAATLDSGAPAETKYADFFEELRGAVEATTYNAASEAGVLAASAPDARGLSFRAVALLGLSEGEFPRAEREDLLLRESDRAILRERSLPIESKLRGDEVTFFYQAVTRARERLLLCRPYLADDGQAWEPSPYWLQVHRLLGTPEVQRIRPEDPLSPAEAASTIEWLQAVGPIDPHLARGAQLLRDRYLRRYSPSSGSGEGDLTGLTTRLTARYPATLSWSASRLESYGTCPFYFYVAHGLNLEPRTPPEEGYDARALGSMWHKILEDTYGRASDPTDLDECLRVLPQVAQEVFATAPADYGFRPTPLWNLQKQELERVLHDTIIALAEVSGGYTPRYFEQRFGFGSPVLVLSTGKGEIRLHGYIDRLDEGPDGRLRVIDYKASGAAINAKHLQAGRRLQLPIYALAARNALGLGEIESGFYWHIGRAEASSLKLEKVEGGIDAAFETAARHIAAHVQHIHAGHFQPQPPDDGCPNYCPAISFCWQYTPKHY